MKKYEFTDNFENNLFYLKIGDKLENVFCLSPLNISAPKGIDIYHNLEDLYKKITINYFSPAFFLEYVNDRRPNKLDTFYDKALEICLEKGIIREKKEKVQYKFYPSKLSKVLSSENKLDYQKKFLEFCLNEGIVEEIEKDVDLEIQVETYY